MPSKLNCESRILRYSEFMVDLVSLRQIIYGRIIAHVVDCPTDSFKRMSLFEAVMDRTSNCQSLMMQRICNLGLA